MSLVNVDIVHNLNKAFQQLPKEALKNFLYVELYEAKVNYEQLFCSSRILYDAVYPFVIIFIRQNILSCICYIQSSLYSKEINNCQIWDQRSSIRNNGGCNTNQLCI